MLGPSLGRLRLPPPGPMVLPGRHSRLGGENGATLGHGAGCGGCSNFLLEYRCQCPPDVPLPSLALSCGATERQEWYISSVLSWPGKLSTEESLAQPSGCWGSSQETLSRGWTFHPRCLWRKVGNAHGSKCEAELFLPLLAPGPGAPGLDPQGEPRCTLFDALGLHETHKLVCACIP